MPHAIWTTPIGSGALRIPLNIGQPGYPDIPSHVDQEWCTIIDHGDPDDEVELYENDAGWDGPGGVGRGDEDVLVRSDLPIPAAWTMGSNDGLDNDLAAVRLAGGNVWFETQPLTILTPGGNACCYSGAFQGEDDHDDPNSGLLGLGVPGDRSGAHGGSGYSVYYGTYMVSEMNGTYGGGAHPIKILVPPSWLSTFASGFRYPAAAADGHYLSAYTGPTPACRMGSVITIPADFDVEALRTTRGQWVAYHLKYWGGHIVDIREDDPEYFTICIENGPDQAMPGGGTGTGEDALAANMGGTFDADTTETTTDDFGLDMRDLFVVMEVVNNYTESEIGGGGTPLLEGGEGGGGDAGAAGWALGGFQFAFADVPEDGGVEFGSAYRTSEYNPIGMQGSIITYYGTAGNKHELRVRLDEGEYVELKSVCDAATMAGTTLTFYANRPLLVNGVEVVVREFSVLWTKNVPGDIDNPGYWYEVRLLLQQTEFTEAPA